MIFSDSHRLLVMMVTFLLIFISVHYYHTYNSNTFISQRHQLVARFKHEELESKINKYNNRQFVPISSAISCSVKGAPLTFEQTQSLIHSVSLLTNYLSGPVYSNYLSLMTRGKEFTMKPDNNTVNAFFNIFLKTNHKYLPKYTSLEQLWRTYFELYVRDTNKSLLTHIGKEGILAEVYIVNSFKSRTAANASQYFDLLVSPLSACIVLKNNPRFIFNNRRTNIFADVLLYVKTNSSTNASPLMIGYYFLPEENAWIPSKLYHSQSIHLNVLF